MDSPITLLGAGGTIATETAKALAAGGHSIRLVSRNPKQVQAGDELVLGDLLDAASIRKAVAGSQTVALVAGLVYETKVWQAQWPVVMRNTVAACKAEGAKLLFFDNVYALGAVDGPMTEATPIKPSSKKGEVRAEVLRILQAAQQEGLTVQIARAPDFYGPKGTLGVVNFMVFDAWAAGKKPALLARDDAPHSYIFTPDAGKAVARLLTTPTAWGQTWNLPVDPISPTGKEFVRLAAAAFGQKPTYSVLPKPVLWVASLFDKTVKEGYELLYQNTRPYLFDSSKFAAAFPDLQATQYAEGLAAVAASYR